MYEGDLLKKRSPCFAAVINNGNPFPNLCKKHKYQLRKCSLSTHSATNTPYYHPQNLNIPFIRHTLLFVKSPVPFISNGSVQFHSRIYLWRISPLNMNNKFLDQQFTFSKLRANPPEISSL